MSASLSLIAFNQKEDENICGECKTGLLVLNKRTTILDNNLFIRLIFF